MSATWKYQPPIAEQAAHAHGLGIDVAQDVNRCPAPCERRAGLVGPSRRQSGLFSQQQIVGLGGRALRPGCTR